MHKKAPPKPLGAMDRKVPESKKYSHIQPTLNTGLTVDKVNFVTAKEYSKRREEIYYRIKPSQMYDLFQEYEAEDYESITDAANKPSDGLKIVTHSEMDMPINEKPYLILDVRDPESYNVCHLLQARNFPYTYMRRDQLHPEIYRFKNKPETLIIVYCNDEKISRDAAKLLVDRGTDNIYLLNGGLFEFASEYPAFIEGTAPPVSIKSGTSKMQQTRLTKIDEEKQFKPTQSGTTGRNDEPNRNGSGLTSSALKKLGDRPPPLSGRSGYSTHREMKSESGRSTLSNMSVAESVISKAASRKGKF